MQCPFPIYFSSSPVRALQLPRTVANMHTHTRLHTYKDSLFFYRCWLRSSLTLMCAPLCILPKIAALARSQKTWFSIHVHVHAYRGRHVTAYIIILPAAVLVDAFCPFLRRSFLPSSLCRNTASPRGPVVSPPSYLPKNLVTLADNEPMVVQRTTAAATTSAVSAFKNQHTLLPAVLLGAVCNASLQYDSSRCTWCDDGAAGTPVTSSRCCCCCCFCRTLGLIFYNQSIDDLSLSLSLFHLRSLSFSRSSGGLYVCTRLWLAPACSAYPTTTVRFHMVARN